MASLMRTVSALCEPVLRLIVVAQEKCSDALLKSVLVENSASIVFDCCKFHRIGSAALKLSWNVHSSSVINCEFTQIGAGPVFHAGNSNTPGSYLTISGFGKRWFNANGIINNHGHHMEISHNEITDGHCTGISNGAE